MDTYWAVISKFWPNGTIDVSVEEREGLCPLANYHSHTPCDCYEDYFKEEYSARDFASHIY